MPGPGGERGCRCCCTLLFLAYAWSAAPADLCGGLLPSRGRGYFRQPWERSGEALTHADLAIISVPASKTKVQGNLLIFHSPVASLRLALGFSRLPRFPTHPSERGGSSSWHTTQKSCVHPGAPNLEGSRQAAIAITARPGLCPKVFLSVLKPGLEIAMPGLGLRPAVLRNASSAAGSHKHVAYCTCSFSIQ